MRVTVVPRGVRVEEREVTVIQTLTVPRCAAYTKGAVQCQRAAPEMAEIDGEDVPLCSQHLERI